MSMDGSDAPKKPDTYRKSPCRRPTRKYIYIIIGVTILCIILCIILAVHLRPKSKRDCPEGLHCDWRSMPHSEFLKDARCSDTLCTTEPCIKSALYALNRIDSSNDPCEDFYAFACGKYEEESVLFPEESEVMFTFQETENELMLALKEVIDSITGKPGDKGFTLRLTKKLYDDCINTDHHPDVMTKEIWRKMFADDGMLPWPLITGLSQTDQRDFVKMMSSSLFYDVNPFFRINAGLQRAANNKTYWMILFRQPSDLDVLKTIYESDNDEARSLRKRYFYSMLKIMNEFEMDDDTVRSVVSNITELEKELIEATTKATESNEKVYEKNEHLRQEFHNHSCQSLDHGMENVKWCKIVEELRADFGLSKKYDIRIELPSLQDYFDAVNGVLSRFLHRDVVSFIAVKFIMGHLKVMPSPLRQLYYQEKDLFQTSQERLWSLSTRWQQCVEIITETLWTPLEKEYIRQKIDAEKVAKVRYMVKKLKEVYISLLDKISWLKKILADDSKKLIQQFKLVIGNLETVLSRDDTTLDNYFASASSKSVLNNPSNPLIADVLEIIKLNQRALLMDNSERHILEFGSSWSFNLFTDYVIAGEIFIPYAAMSFPMHLPGRPMFVEYAALGSYVFSYMTNLLLANMEGGNSSVETLANTAKCLQEQSHLYKTGKSTFKVKMSGRYKGIPPVQAQAFYEFLNALGILGSFEGYSDYLKENGDKGLPGLPFTNVQLFFISSAQIHCEKLTENGYKNYPYYLRSPARYRVNVPLANSKAFSEAFRCPVGSSMNPKRKCCIFGDGKLSHECK